MKLAIQASGIQMSVSMIDHIERRAAFALSRISLHVQQVRVRLTDLNGPRGGVDKRCHLQIQLQNEEPLIVAETCADMLAAINKAFSIASQHASRRIARRLTKARSLRDQGLRRQKLKDID